MKIKKLLANLKNYGGLRPLTSVKYIVFHYTGNKGDTAENNAKYFHNNTTGTSAHFFVDRQGDVYQSVDIIGIAYAVGKDYRSGRSGEAKYYGKCTNANSASIELCDCADKAPSWEQMKAAKELVAHIQKKCPNAKNIIRHWDVNGKACPARMTGKNNKEWKHFYNYLVNGYQFKVRVKEPLWIRSSGKVTEKNKIRKAIPLEIFKITKVVGNWGRLKAKTKDGKWRWVNLKKCKEI